jgi:hypothetical protein
MNRLTAEWKMCPIHALLSFRQTHSGCTLPTRQGLTAYSAASTWRGHSGFDTAGQLLKISNGGR